MTLLSSFVIALLTTIEAECLFYAYHLLYNLIIPYFRAIVYVWLSKNLWLAEEI